MTAASTIDLRQLADRLRTEAAGPRALRSPEYLDGIAAAILNRSEGMEVCNPHAPGSASADAWWAGCREGHDRFDIALGGQRLADVAAL